MNINTPDGIDHLRLSWMLALGKHRPLVKLASQLRTDPAALSGDERNLLAIWIERNGRPFSKGDLVEMRGASVALVMAVVKGTPGLKSEAWVAKMAEMFGVERRQIFNDLAKHKVEVADWVQIHAKVADLAKVQKLPCGSAPLSPA